MAEFTALNKFIFCIGTLPGISLASPYLVLEKENIGHIFLICESITIIDISTHQLYFPNRSLMLLMG